MIPTRLLLTIPLMTSCAYAPGSDPDAGRADARERADGAPGSATDAGASIDAAQVIIDAAVGTPDAVPTDAETIVDTLVISEIVDATLSGGLPKFVEITNVGSVTVDLSAYSLGLYSNSNTTLTGASSHGLSGSLPAGASYVVSFESSTFFSVYGETPDDISGSANISGNDTVVLFRGSATSTGADAVTVDVYGEIGVDGTGQAWEYKDGFATRRQAATTPKASFDANDWGFSGPGALNGAITGEIALATSPGTH